ncbi:MAG: hypothetical protein JSV65_03275 [Armatimonadota bacterium]|nr:MAG: hypothetical protein JSV65_03275 [Armatimonadota bacterium]
MTLRAALVGLAVAVFFAAIVPYTDLYLQGSKLAFNHLPISALITLFLLIAIANTLLRRLSPRRTLSAAELAAIYIIVLVAAPLPSGGYAEFFPGVTTAAFYFATDENQYAIKFQPYLKNFLSPQDPDAIKWLYEGLPPGKSIPWGVWVAPFVAWGIFVMLLVSAFFFLTMILRRQWIENERLTFPLAQVPLEMVQQADEPSLAAPFFRSKVMWFGFISIALLDSLNSLHLYYPSLPMINMAHLRAFQGLKDRPWSAINDVEIFIYPAVIGVSYLLSQEVGASLWAFFWFSKLQKVALYAYGLDLGGKMGGPNTGTFLRIQEIGGFFVLTYVVLYAVRRQVIDAFRRRVPADPTAPMSIRWATIGFVVATLMLAGWGYAAGMNYFFALLGIVFFYVMVLGLTRLVNAGGALWVEANWLPYDVINIAFGSVNIPVRTLYILGMQQQFFMFDQRNITMPYLMDGSKIGHSTGLRGRHLAIAAGLAVFLSMIVGTISVLTIAYKYGGVRLDQWYFSDGPLFPLNDVSTTMEEPEHLTWFAAFSFTYGVGMMSLLTFLNKNYLWFRISPLGYIFGSTWTMGHLWFSVLVGWLCSYLATRGGGLRFYREMRPFFIGMVLGEFVISGIWLPIDWYFGVRGHVIFPIE